MDLAKQAMAEIENAYRVAGNEDVAELAVHGERHVFDSASAVTFLDSAFHVDGGEK